MELIYSPAWFIGKDLLIDMCGALILALIAFFSWRFYRINPKKKTYLYLAVSFFVISLSFLFKILTNFTIYYNVQETRQIGEFLVTYRVIQSSDILLRIGLLAHRMLMLSGLYMLFAVYDKQSKGNTALMLFFILVATFFSRDNYYLFHVMALLLFTLVTARFMEHSKKNTTITSKMIAASFITITISHLVFCFVHMNLAYYAWAEMIQLVGYLMLLIAFIKVLSNGKKKKQD